MFHNEHFWGLGHGGRDRTFMGSHHLGQPGDDGKLRLRRFFNHGDLRLAIMQLINEKSRHGYEIIKAIEEKVSGAYSPSPGVVYPTLTMLEELGYIKVGGSDGGGSKKLYSITNEGIAFIAANKTAIDAIFAKLAELNAAQSQRPPQVVRAMQNVRVALQMRIGRGDLTEEQAHAIAAALDTAATAIEKV